MLESTMISMIDRDGNNEILDSRSRSEGDLILGKASG
jgi:hypothetical protein